MPVISYLERANLPSRDLASPSSLCPFSAYRSSAKGKGKLFDITVASVCPPASKFERFDRFLRNFARIIPLQDACLLFCMDVKSDLSQ